MPRPTRPAVRERAAAGRDEGSLTPASHPKQIRERALRTLASAASQPGAPLRILEVGSRTGDSAILWAHLIGELGTAGGRVTCVDPWVAYQEDPETFETFKANIQRAGVSHLIEMRRGLSNNVLPTLAVENYDLVYIDGDHSYAQVKADIEHAMPLVRMGGILGGDDLEVLFGECNQALALKWAEFGAEYERDPGTGLWYHPGVTVAVLRCFGTVWRSGLTWGVRKTASGWGTIG